jgi:putative ABC transport system permease protein
LYQFYEPYHGTIHETRPRDRGKKGHRSSPHRLNQAIPGGSDPVGPAGCYVGIGAGCYPAACFRRGHREKDPTSRRRHELLGAIFRIDDPHRLHCRFLSRPFPQLLPTRKSIIGTLVVSEQINYLQTTGLGYDRDNLIYIPLEGQLTEKYALFKEEALKLPGIRTVSCMNYSPTSIEGGTINMDWDGKSPSYAPSFTQAAVGYDFFRAMGIKMVEGRDFSKAYPTDTANYVLNETAVEMIGYKTPVGRNFTFWGTKGKIIGVIKNFHFTSLHDKVNALVLRFDEHLEDGVVVVKMSPAQTRPTLASLEHLCKNINPSFPFTYQFSDEQYQKFYASEAVIGQLSHYFAILAILISCMGLLGLTLYTAEQRTKEIGIRKVLGAGAAQLFLLLSRDFLWLVLLAFGIAAPLAWLAMQRWLGDYAYHIDLGPKVFLLAGLAAFTIAMLTVSYHSFRTARANPVRSLRSE